VTSHGALAFSATASTMAEKILPLVVDGCGPQRTHPANISDGRTEKKGPGGKMAEKWRKQPASRSVQLALDH